MNRVVLRRAGYLVVAVAASVAIGLVSTSRETAVVAIVQAVATIALAGVGIEAVIYNQELVAAARAEADAAGKEATATLAAVEATRAATSESRRQAALASVPSLAMSRPIAQDRDDGLRIHVKVENLGPGHALQVVLSIDAAYAHELGSFLSGTVRSGSLVSMIAERGTASLEFNAREYRNLDGPRWSPSDAYGQPSPAPPISSSLQCSGSTSCR